MKKSISVGGYKVEAERDKNGLLILTVRGTSRRRVIMVDHPESGTKKFGERLAFTDNATIIDYELDTGETPDCRINPKRLRHAAKDPAFRAWWKLIDREDPDKYADRIDEMRRREMAAKQSDSKKIECGAGGRRGGN